MEGALKSGPLEHRIALHISDDSDKVQEHKSFAAERCPRTTP